MNDDIANTVKKYPKRFIGLGTLPMQVRVFSIINSVSDDLTSMVVVVYG